MQIGNEHSLDFIFAIYLHENVRYIRGRLGFGHNSYRIRVSLELDSNEYIQPVG